MIRTEHYNEDDAAEMSPAEIQAVFHTPEYQEFLRLVEAQWDELSDEDEEFLRRLDEYEPKAETPTNWSEEGF